MPEPTIDTLCQHVGERGIAAVTRRFYERVRHDDLLGPMYPPDDWEAAERRLRLFLVQRFGGPSTYSEERGHPRLRMRHAPFVVDDAAATRWIDLMTAAIEDAEAGGEISVHFRPVALPFLEQVAGFLRNRPS
jgi:hemoglobin